MELVLNRGGMMPGSLEQRGAQVLADVCLITFLNSKQRKWTRDARQCCCQLERPCIGYCFTAYEGNMQKKHSTGWVSSSSQKLWQWSGIVLETQVTSDPQVLGRDKLGLVWALENEKPTSSDTPLPIRSLQWEILKKGIPFHASTAPAGDMAPAGCVHLCLPHSADSVQSSQSVST